MMAGGSHESAHAALARRSGHRQFFQRSLPERGADRHARTLDRWPARRAARGRTPFRSVKRKPFRSGRWEKPDLVIDVPEQQIPASGVHRLPLYRYPPCPSIGTCGCVRWTSGRATTQSCTTPRPILDFNPELEESFFAIYAAGFQVEPFPRAAGDCCRRDGAQVPVALHRGGLCDDRQARLAIYLHKRPPSRELVRGQCLDQEDSAYLRTSRIIPLRSGLCSTRTRCCIRSCRTCIIAAAT